MAWEHTFWSWRLLSAAGWWGKQAHGTGLVLGRPHNGRHGDLLPRSGWCRWVRMVGGFPVSSWGESSPTPFGRRVTKRPEPMDCPRLPFKDPKLKGHALYQIGNAKDALNFSDFGCLDLKAHRPQIQMLNWSWTTSLEWVLTLHRELGALPSSRAERSSMRVFWRASSSSAQRAFSFSRATFSSLYCRGTCVGKAGSSFRRLNKP